MLGQTDLYSSRSAAVWQGAFFMETETEGNKESWSEDCMKALAALANTRGETLRVGVRDNGNVLGWDGGGKEQEAISDQIVNSTGAASRTATRDLEQLTGRGLLEQSHRLGQSVHQTSCLSLPRAKPLGFESASPRLRGRRVPSPARAS